MLERWRQDRALRRAAREMTEARKSGSGVYLEEWDLAAGAHSPTDDVIEWCRNVIARSRRPFGIDHFDLALALSTAAPGRPASRLYRLRPADLYCDTTMAQLAAFFVPHVAQPARVAAALFSWGDAAHHAIPADR